MGLSVAEFSVGAQSAFGQTSALAARNLAELTYPLARFSSAYAATFGAGFRGPTAMGVHVAVLALATAAVAVVVVRTRDRRAPIGVTFA